MRTTTIHHSLNIRWIVHTTIHTTIYLTGLALLIILF